MTLIGLEEAFNAEALAAPGERAFNEAFAAWGSVHLDRMIRREQ